nr:unnamed protein product [Callosobruchus analis]
MLSILIILLFNLLPTELDAKCITHLNKERVDGTFSDRMSYETAPMRIVAVTTTCINVSLPLEGFVEHFCDDCTREIRIFASNIPNMRRIAFHGIRDLNILRIDGTNTSYVEPGTFAGMSKLRELYFTNNNIQKTFNNVFNPLPGLKTLDLSQNALTEFEPKFLAGNLNLMYLNVSSNRLTSLDFKDIDHSIKLVIVDLTGNLISTINFVNISATFGYISHNRLRQIEGCTLNVQNLDLSYNNMSTLPLLDNKCSKRNFEVAGLNLSHNALRQLDSYFFQAFPKLSFLDVSHNMIGNLPTAFFQYLPVMNVFNISHNMLDEFDVGILDAGPKLKYLNLSNNKISVIKGKISIYYDKGLQIHIQCNPIQYKMLMILLSGLPPKTNLHIDLLQKSFTWQNFKEVSEAAKKANVTIVDEMPVGCGDNEIIRKSSTTEKFDHKSVLGNITGFINTVKNGSKTVDTTLDHSNVMYNDSIHATDRIHKLLEQLDKSIHDVVDETSQHTNNDPKACEENETSALVTAVIVLFVFVMILVSILIAHKYTRRLSYFVRRGEENIELLNNSMPKNIEVLLNALSEFEPKFLASNLNLKHLNLSSNRLTSFDFKDMDHKVFGQIDMTL